MYNHQLDTFIQTADAGSFSKAVPAPENPNGFWENA